MNNKTTEIKNKNYTDISLDFNLEEDIQNLIDCQAISFFPKEENGNTNAYIPYIMNDAVECCLAFYDCKIQGQWDMNDKGQPDFTIVDEPGKKALILRQTNGNTVSLWYSDVRKTASCYQYHRIAHVWIKGHEKWRRIIYLIGTIHEKYTFLGPEFCNETELGLVHLVEFNPFRHYTPLHESLDDYYPNTQEGIDTIRQIANHLNSKKIHRIIDSYEKALSKGLISQFTVHRLAHSLIKCDDLLEYINEQIDKASLEFPERRYSLDEEKMIADAKEKIVDKYLSAGFEGQYPVMTKGRKKVTFYEEQPYVLRDFEYEGYTFKINPL